MKKSATTQSSDTQRQYYATFPEFLITEKYHREIGNAVWLLLYLLLKCDWELGHTLRKEQVIADALGVTTRTIRNWFRKLEDLGVTTRQVKYSLEIQLPESLTPRIIQKNSKSGKTEARDRKTHYARSEKPQPQGGKESEYWKNRADQMRRESKHYRP